MPVAVAAAETDTISSALPTTALVVDDDPVVLATHCAMLRRLGLDPVTASDGIEAMSVLHRAWPVRIALLDWHMAPLNGYAFATALRADEAFTELPIVMITAEDRPERISQAYSVGIDAVLPKPLTLETLERVLKQGRSGGPARPPAAAAVRSWASANTRATGDTASRIVEMHGYRLGARLGGGGMAEVFAVEGTDRDRLALKISSVPLTSDQVPARRFQREAGILRTLRHPNVLRVVEAGVVSDRWYLIMERLESDLLAECAAAGGRLGVTRSRAVVADIAAALSAVHATGVIHRDLKPANVLIRADATAVLSDFGVAAFRRDRLRMTEQGRVIGTPAYMPPEAVMGRSEANEALDIYGLGATWWHCLTGHPPFEGDCPWSTFQRIVHDPLPDVREWAPDCPDADRKLLEACLAKEPAARLPDATQLLTRLASAVAEIRPESGNGSAGV